MVNGVPQIDTTPSGHFRYYRLSVAAAASLTVSLRRRWGTPNLYVAYDYLPTNARFDQVSLLSPLSASLSPPCFVSAFLLRVGGLVLVWLIFANTNFGNTGESQCGSRRDHHLSRSGGHLLHWRLW